MSRIHEALRKAAQEKTSQLSGGGQPDLAGMAAIPGSVLSENHIVEEIVCRTLTQDGGPFLRFDNLVKQCTHPEWKPDAESSLFLRGNDSTRIGAECFRTMRSRLYQIAATRPLSKLLVTSSVPAEGKTFVASNLAHSIVRQPDRRALLIDADLRSPRLHVTLGAPTTPGLTDYLHGNADESAVIQHDAEVNLCFIPCGRPVANPSELLSGDRMKKLLDLVTPIFDWVILDSPPALPVHDASILADLCDGVLLVVKAGETSYEIAEKGILEFRDKKVLGVVLNQVEKADAYGHLYYSDSDKEKGDVCEPRPQMGRRT